MTTPAPDVLTKLRYITQSPSREHGGFHEQTVKTAQNAVEEIKRLRGENAMLRRIIELNSNIEATFVDGTPEAMVAQICKLTHQLDNAREALQRIASGPSTFTPFSEMPRIAKYALPLVAPNR